MGRAAVAVVAGARRGGAMVRDRHVRYAMADWSGATQTGLLISLVLALLVWLARAATPLAAVTGGVLAAVLTLALARPALPFGAPAVAGALSAHLGRHQIR